MIFGGYDITVSLPTAYNNNFVCLTVPWDNTIDLANSGTQQGICSWINKISLSQIRVFRNTDGANFTICMGY